MGKNYRIKARFSTYRHNTKTPESMTYSSVVPRDSVSISLTIAALDYLYILD